MQKLCSVRVNLEVNNVLPPNHLSPYRIRPLQNLKSARSSTGSPKRSQMKAWVVRSLVFSPENEAPAVMAETYNCPLLLLSEQGINESLVADTTGH